MLRIALSMLAALVTTIVLAQGPAPTTYRLEALTGQDIVTIGDALGTQPYNKVAPLIAKLQGQIMAQEAAAKAPPPAPPAAALAPPAPPAPEPPKADTP